MHFPRRVVLVGLLGIVLIVGLLCPTTIVADSSLQGAQDPAQCVDCHPAEAQTWQDSPHARALDSAEDAMRTACAGTQSAGDCACLQCHATGYDSDAGTFDHRGVACEACHGLPTDKHPTEANMAIAGDSSLCQSCHGTTHSNWSDSAHGQADVQCIACHQVHGQDLRLESQVTLCVSCHQQVTQDQFHLSHLRNEIACSDCHMPADLGDHLALENVIGIDSQVAAAHDFGAPIAEACVECHTQSVSSVQTLNAALVEEQASRLAFELDEAKEASRTWQTLSFVTLGVGLGVGGILGAVAVLVVGCIYKQKERS